MKSITVSAADIVCLRQTGFVTLEKSREQGDFMIHETLAIREPWQRNHEGQFVYKADFEAEDKAYKWSAPSSMPEDAVRHYGKITGIDSTAEETKVSITMEAVTIGEDMICLADCPFCGQVVDISIAKCKTAEEAAAMVIDYCSCDCARSESHLAERIEDGKLRVEQLFGENAQAFGFVPVAEPSAIALLKNIVELVARKVCSSTSLYIRGYCKAKISMTSKDAIKVERSETRSYNLETE